MDQKLEKELYRFLRQSKFSVIKIILPFLGIPLIFTIIGFNKIKQGNLSVGEYVFYISNVLISALFIYMIIFSNKHYNKKMKELAKSAEYSRVLNDYKFSKSMAYDQVKLGDLYVFGRESETVLPYEKISSIFQYIHIVNGFENDRELRANTVNGGRITICKLPTDNLGDKTFFEVAHYMKQKNPEIKISKY